jgi:hypothetical protein
LVCPDKLIVITYLLTASRRQSTQAAAPSANSCDPSPTNTYLAIHNV